MCSRHSWGLRLLLAPASFRTCGIACLPQVSATTLDDVWYPLIKKKGQNKKPVAAEAAVNSDLSARYRIVPRADQVSQASGVSKHQAFRYLLHYVMSVLSSTIPPVLSQISFF